MQSISKAQIAEPMIRELIQHTLDQPAKHIQELTDGYFNAAYLVELSDGTKCVLKVAPPKIVRVLRYERDIMQAEVAVMQLVRQRTSVPVPAIYGYDPSGALIESPFFIMEYVAGTTFNQLRSALSAEAQAAIERAAGGFLRKINAIEGPHFGYAPASAAQYRSWPEAFLAMVDGVLNDGQDMQVALPLDYAELRRQFQRCAPALAEVTTPRLLHWDIWDGNIFVDPSSQCISAIIDFERALWGDPLMEPNFRAVAEHPAFAAGYGQDMLDSAAKRCRRTLYNIHFYLILIIESYYRQFETADQEHWARAQLAQELPQLASYAEAYERR